MKSKFFMIFTIITIVSAIFYFIYQSISDEKIVKELSLQKAEFKFRERDRLLSSFINKFDQTLIGIKENKNFIDFIQGKHKVENINELFLSAIKSLPSIVQFRYINSLGNEIIRVDKNYNKHSYIVLKNKLQNKKNRYYFKDIYNTKENTIWHSKIDLNIEHGKIVIPIQPTLRVGTPVVIDGINKGILIINIDVNSFLNKLQTASIFNIYIIDKDGDFLIHINKNYSWGKYLNKNNSNVFNYFNYFSKELLLKDEIITENFYANKTTFKNDDKLIMIIETKKSKILEDMKDKAQNRLYWMLAVILIIISIGYILFKRRHIELVEQHSSEIEVQKENIQSILDTQQSIVILTNGSFIHDCNKRFLEFFGYKNLDTFIKEHDCICDFFEEDKEHNYLLKNMHKLIWTEYLLLHKDEIVKVKMTNVNKLTYIFQVNAKSYNIDNTANDKVITFSDVTQLENLNDNLESVVSEKTKELQGINENLETKIKEEVEKNQYIQEKLFKSEKMASMGEMIENIAHQWRQPLSVISTASTGMLMQKEYGILNDEQFKETCGAINNNAQYLSKTIDDFRDFIKADKRKNIFSLKDDINSFLNLVEGYIKSNNINIILDLKEGIKINVYQNELTQCFINIFNNAKDILKEKEIANKFIFISTFIKEDKAIIKIKDNGGGIQKNIINKVFEPYFTTKHQSQGTGLGLHMTYNLIVDGMNGTIEVNNVTYVYDGKEYTGAEFVITLPIS